MEEAWMPECLHGADSSLTQYWSVNEKQIFIAWTHNSDLWSYLLNNNYVPGSIVGFLPYMISFIPLTGTIVTLNHYDVQHKVWKQRQTCNTCWWQEHKRDGYSHTLLVEVWIIIIFLKSRFDQSVLKFDQCH